LASEQLSSQDHGHFGSLEVTKAEFAERLKSALLRKGWTPAETARQASRYLSQDDKLGRAHMWHYLQGRALPRGRYLLALSRALEIEPGDLIPGRSPAAETFGQHSWTPGLDASGRADMLHVRDYGDGTALLEVAQRVPWETALEVILILKPRSA
jgi:transcriptional regulator with XRE-family HTH domain